MIANMPSSPLPERPSLFLIGPDEMTSSIEQAKAINPWSLMLAMAVKLNDAKLVRELLQEREDDPSMGDPNRSAYLNDAGEPPLFAALLDFRYEALLVLLDCPHVDINLRHHGLTAVQRLVSTCGHPRLLSTLIEAGANAKSLGWHEHGGGGWSLAQGACRFGSGTAAQSLAILQHVGLLDIQQRDKNGDGLLHLALKPPIPSMVTLDRLRSTVRASNLCVEIPSPKPANPAILWLLEHGADVLTVNHQGQSVMDAAQSIRQETPEVFAAVEQAWFRQGATRPDDALTTVTLVGSTVRPRL